MKRFLVTVLLLASAHCALFGAFNATAVQTVICDTGNAGNTSVTCTWGSTPTQGNILVLAINHANSNLVFTLAQTGVVWVIEGNPATQGTGPSELYICIGRVISGSASTTLTVGQLGAVSATISVTGAEFTGIAATPDQIGSSTGSSAAPVSTGSALTGNASYELSIGILGMRGQWATNNTQNPFSIPTNSYTLVAQDNTFRNTSNADRATAILAKVITNANTASAINAAGATITSAAWAGKHVSFRENQQGFMTR